MPPFRFKQFSIAHDRCAHKVGTDGVLLGAWVEANHPKKILDVGTGSGLIALMLAQRFPEAQITGIELHHPSAEQAKENATNSTFANRTNILHGNFLYHDFRGKFDLIISNPPFFKGNTSTGKAERDRARHEEHLPQVDFLKKAISLLAENGLLAVILPKAEAEDFIKSADDRELYTNRLTRVFGRPGAEDKRWLVEMTRQSFLKKESDFTLRNEGGTWSKEYEYLTKAFHPGL